MKLSRAKQLPELTNQMDNATVEGLLGSWLQYPDGDLSQHSLAKAVAKLTKKSREAESLSDKLALFFKIAREKRIAIPYTIQNQELKRRKKSGKLESRDCGSRK